MRKLKPEQKKERDRSIKTVNQSIKELEYMNDCIERGIKVDRRKTPVHNRWFNKKPE